MKKKNRIMVEEVDEKKIRRKSLLAFSCFVLLLLLAFIGWRWVNNQPKEQGALKPLRKTLDINEAIFTSTFNSNKLVKEYPLSAAAKRVRVNGKDGLSDSVDGTTWRLQVVKSPGDTLKISLDELKQLPQKDIVFDFKCIEGWSQVTHWGGVPVKQFVDHYGLQPQSKMKYVGL